jgi:serine/threonine-protein kinase HipA
MGRPSRSQALNIWMNGERVGVWHLPNRRAPEFVYDPAWLESPAFRPLSLSLPATPVSPVVRGEQVNAFFDNLLPDSEAIRRRLQQRFKTASREAFDLLAAVGRDCVGAVQLLPVDESPADITRIEARPLDDEAVEQALINATATSGWPGQADEDDFRISIAGAQEKTALLWHEGRWCQPLDATPTTHLFKLPLGLVGNRQADMRTSVENEWLCAKVLQAFDIPVARCEIREFGQQKCLVVERFDRKLHSSGVYWLRLPQEDFCQATGTPPHLKYEADGGPGMVDICKLLAHSEERDRDLRIFFKTQILFWMLRATDGHAKNFSLFLLPGGRYRMTPMYDVLSAWPVIGNSANRIPPQKVRLAQAWLGKNKHYLAEGIQQRHFDMTALKCGVGIQAGNVVEELVGTATQAIAAVASSLPPGFPQDVADAVLGGLQRSADRLTQSV